MSILYLSICEEALAETLSANLLNRAKSADWFEPATIIVPNPFVGKWLRLWLARKLGIIANIRITYRLEAEMAELLKRVDSRSHPLPLQFLNDDQYRLMVVAALLDREMEEDDPFRTYLGGSAKEQSRDFWRRVWQLGGRLAGLIRDYEYHRQAELIQQWLKHQDSNSRLTQSAFHLERAQRALFYEIVREPDGLRARLQVPLKCLPKTLPQYANEVMELPPTQVKRLDPQPTVHFFGLGQVSSLHVHTLQWLGALYDLRVYHVNPLVGQLDGQLEGNKASMEKLERLADRYRDKPFQENQSPKEGEELLKAWTQAGAEGLGLLSELLKGEKPFKAKVIVPIGRLQRENVLTRIQESLRNPCHFENRLPQDTSLQIVACPGIFREVETVCQSILHNLHRDPSLKQTDIAVLATDMTRYRPVIQAVFDREPGLISYTLADYSAAELSTYGHAVMGVLDLALESFTRSRVLDVLLNPCFLAKLEVDREQADLWPRWVEALGIYNGWDQEDKTTRGHGNSAIHSWQLGLRRLRLGRLMDVPNDNEGQPAPRFQDVIPFADLDASDRDNLETFVRAVDRFLPRLVNIRTLATSASRWAEELSELFEDFLGIPDNQLGEVAVRNALNESLAQFKILDALRKEANRNDLTLSLIREMVLESLETLKARKGDPLVSGVSVGSLQSFAQVPFKIIYVLGMGEGLFPGSNQLPGLDLRSRKRSPGDILPAEQNRFHFLQALLSARERVYLLFNCRELQKDQELHPCGPINQLRRFVREHITAGDAFKIAYVPLLANDPRLLGENDDAPFTDVFVNYSTTDRLLALAQAKENGRVALTPEQERNFQHRFDKAKRTFALPPKKSVSSDLVTISLSWLKQFLNCPAEATLKRHLGLSDEEEIEIVDTEPFYTGHLANAQFVKTALKRCITASRIAGLNRATLGWRQQFHELYEEWRLRGQTPDGAFGLVNRLGFEKQLQTILDGPEGLTQFLEARASSEFCGPVLLGQSPTQIKPRRRLPALQLDIRNPNSSSPCLVSVTGSLAHVWRSSESVDVLVLTNKKQEKVPVDRLNAHLLEPALFYLALRSHSMGNDGERREWLGEREFRVHLVHKEGINCVSFHPHDFSSDEATGYLCNLANDLLDRSSFDLLPFELLLEKDLCEAFEGARHDSAAFSPQDYTRRLQEAFDADQEKPEYKTYYPMTLFQLVEPRVPSDAYEKVQCRFQLLDRGPARYRRDLQESEENS
jgi:exodeoxyribonuclease V gamma subunit